MYIYLYTGTSSFDDWLYCVKYTTIDGGDMECNCTRGLQITLTPLISDTLYRFTVSASGPGGESETPNVFVFQTKPTGKSSCFHKV